MTQIARQMGLGRMRRREKSGSSCSRGSYAIRRRRGRRRMHGRRGSQIDEGSHHRVSIWIDAAAAIRRSAVATVTGASSRSSIGQSGSSSQDGGRGRHLRLLLLWLRRRLSVLLLLLLGVVMVGMVETGRVAIAHRDYLLGRVEAVDLVRLVVGIW